jgi:hypothetical protein
MHLATQDAHLLNLFITSSGIANVESNALVKSYKQCYICRVKQGMTHSTMQMIIILCLLNVLTVKSYNSGCS